PFLQAARSGKLDLPHLKNFAIQEMFVSVAFPAMMAEVICKIPYRAEAIRYPLIINMFEEAGEHTPAESHPNLLRDLARWLGASSEELADSRPLAETTHYLDKLFALCRSRDYSE